MTGRANSANAKSALPIAAKVVFATRSRSACYARGPLPPAVPEARRLSKSHRALAAGMVMPNAMELAEAMERAYVERDHQHARNHKWYMSARQITVNDLYSFDPDVVVPIDRRVHSALPPAGSV